MRRLIVICSLFGLMGNFDRLPAAEMTIDRVTVLGVAGQVITGTVRLDEANERATLAFPQTLEPGSWQLTLQFSGILNDKLHGFYRSTYKDANGQEKVSAA